VIAALDEGNTSIVGYFPGILFSPTLNYAI